MQRLQHYKLALVRLKNYANMEEKRDYNDLILAVEKAIQEKVNGKIDRISEEMTASFSHQDRRLDRLEKGMNELRGIRDGIHWVDQLKGYLKELVSWLIPLSIITATLVAVYNFLK